MGKVQLHELEFEVRPGVFIPRHETEVLIESVRDLDFGEALAPQRMLELGTGSGVVGISLLVHWTEAQLWGLELSEAAFELTNTNAETHGVTRRLHSILGDAFAPEHRGLWNELDLVVSNPPYVAEGERDQLEPEVSEHDPEAALFAGPEGLDEIARLIEAAAPALRSGGWLAFEHGANQEGRIASLLAGDRWRQVSCVRDLADRPRVTLARRV